MATTVDGIPVGGSTGKITFGRNRYGAYTRRRTKPVNPNSTRQATVRGFFRTAVTAWFDTLTVSERLAWKTYAEATPWLNRAGESTFLSGQAAFIRQYTHLLDVLGGSSALAEARVAPAIPATGALNITLAELVYDISDTAWNLNLATPIVDNSWNDGDADSYLTVAISEPMSPGRTFRPNKFQKLLSEQAPGVPADSLNIAPVSVPFPYALSIAGGQHVWFRFRGYSATNRWVSVEQIVGPVLTTTQP